MTTPTSTRTRPHAAATRGGSRLAALDRLRGLALVAMLFHHLLDWISGDAREVIPGWRYFVVTDVAAVAFFCVSGASLALFATSRRRRGASRGAVAVEVLRRYGLLVPIGLLIHLAIFRTEYGFGVLEAIGITVVAAASLLAVVPTRVLPAVAAGVLVLGPWLERRAADESGWVAEHLLGGTFPVVTYLGFVLVGVAASRHGLLGDRRGVQLAAVVMSAGVALLVVSGVEPDRYPGDAAFVLPGLAGTALALAACQLTWPRVLRRFDRFVRDAGARALGLFIGHYLIYGLLQEAGWMRQVDQSWGVALAAAVTTGLCLLAPHVPQLPWSPRTGRRT
ncbi:heparan-alpha-glucosaminide N-acetyltransferase domain-containing protein [Actinomarinicola tropica]|uniref:DUF1624 domain-containing protein n=1 Tax=Actinomarinicola tropica TaxID=2789776 RepID=A0A5Q2RIL2_9ACTN|nr:heparan-alpha-glucosaminide N-acetyltransferase domain-containing protein [Actinomarinicola tropica]QGG94411.1 DUF1624 domain-containing protein [Actinomarinicola tropica]